MNHRSKAPGRRFFAGTGLAVALVPIALASIVATQSGSLSDLMRYQRAEILHGEWWRLLSCHFVHLGAIHLAMNLAALIALAYVFSGTLRPNSQALSLFAGAWAVGCGLLFAEPQVAWYAGLSGALHALFFCGAVVWLRDRPLLGAISLVAAACKLALELGGNAFWLQDASFPVVTAAHRWGAAGGLVCGLALLAMQRSQARDQHKA